MLETQTCADKWKSFESSCYLFVTPTPPNSEPQLSNWETARLYCLNRSADLISLTTQDEVNFVFQHTKNMTNIFWIGLKYNGTKKEHNATWMWSNGDKLKINKWAPGEPNLLDSEHCGLIKKASKYWNNNPCSNSRAWICEKAKKKDKSVTIFGTGEQKTNIFFYLGKNISNYMTI